MINRANRVQLWQKSSGKVEVVKTNKTDGERRSEQTTSLNSSALRFSFVFKSLSISMETISFASAMLNSPGCNRAYNTHSSN
jgi:hypothetical protein